MKIMKNMIFLSIFLYSTVGCGEDDGSRAEVQFVTFDEEFQIGINEKVVVTGNGLGEVTDSLLVEMITIKDTRCPRGVMCISGGAAEIAIKASAREQSEILAVCIGTDCSHLNQAGGEHNTLEFVLGDISYLLIFESAVPVPSVEGNKKNNGAEKAILKVTR